MALQHKIIRNKTVKGAMSDAKQMYGENVEIISVDKVGGLFAITIGVTEKGIIKKTEESSSSEYVDLKEKLDTLIGAVSKMIEPEIRAQLIQVQNDGKKMEHHLNGELRDLILKLGFKGTLASRIEARSMEIGRGQVVKDAVMKTITEMIVAQGHAESFETGLCAIVGTTGSGKTTTIAKLVGRALQTMSASEVGLVTTDFYRVGAYEQLRMYADLMGVKLVAVKQESELEMVLTQMKTTKKVVYIDTIGSARDDEKNDIQMKLLVNQDVKCALAIQASLSRQSMILNAQRWKALGATQMIVTKWDEVDDVTPIVETIIQEGLPLQWITNGQKVPKDLHKIQPMLIAHKTVNRKF